MKHADLFMGFPVLARGVEVDRDELNTAIAAWRRHWLSPLGSPTDLNAARELEIERDYGVRVAINTRR